MVSLILAVSLTARQKLEVFELQNRDAESLVPVIASALGPEARVTADVRTNSLLVSYPEEMQDNLRAIIRQLDQGEPNIEVEVTTFDIETALIEQLGLTARSGLGPDEYAALLPLLMEDRRATLAGRQSVATRANLPARISLSTLSTEAPGQAEPQRNPPTALAVIPRTLGDEMIELKFAHISPALAGESGVGSVFSTIILRKGGAQLFRTNREYSLESGAQIPILPLGIKRSFDGVYERVIIMSAKVL